MKDRLPLLLTLFTALFHTASYAQSPHRNTGHTTFQVGQPYRPTMQVNADAAIVYGTAGNPTEGRMGLTFENAFLEYGCLESMTRPTGRSLYRHKNLLRRIRI